MYFRIASALIVSASAVACSGAGPSDGPESAGSTSEAVLVHCAPGYAPVCSFRRACVCAPFDPPPPPPPPPCTQVAADVTLSGSALAYATSTSTYGTPACDRFVVDITDLASASGPDLRPTVYTPWALIKPLDPTPACDGSSSAPHARLLWSIYGQLADGSWETVNADRAFPACNPYGTDTGGGDVGYDTRYVKMRWAVQSAIASGSSVVSYLPVEVCSRAKLSR